MVNNSVVFAGFIAPKLGDEFDPSEDIPRGIFYGDQVPPETMNILRKRSDKLMKIFMKREATPEQVTQDQPEAKEKKGRWMGRLMERLSRSTLGTPGDAKQKTPQS